VAADLKRIAKRSGAAWAAKDLWRGMLDDAYEFCLPMRNRWSTQSEGEQKMDRVFDSTAIEATQRFSSRLQSQLTPPFQHWADLTAGPIVPPDQLQMVQAKLQTITKQLFAAIHASNFDTSIGEVYLDGAITTAAMLVLEGDDNSPLNFIAAPSHTFATDDGVYGGVDGVFRRWEAPVREIRSTWPEADISADMEKIERDTPEKKLKLQEATFWDQKQGYYCYVVWEEATAANGEPHKIVERKYQEHPWVVFQWMKVAGESQARGPALYVLPDIKTLNKTKELILKNASLAVSGVWTAVDDGVINPDTVEIVPGAVIGVEASGNLQALQFGGRFDVAQMVVQDLQMGIKRALFDNQLPSDTGPVRSPTEILARVKELQEEIGAPFGRVVNTFLRPMLQRCLNILARKGMIDVPLDPKTGRPTLKIDGMSVKLEVTSPLARLQSATDVDRVVNWLQISQLAGPEAFAMGVKVEDVPGWLAAALGVDLKLTRSPEEKKALMEMAGQAMAQQQQGAAPQG
jgi:hypothetical protein